MRKNRIDVCELAASNNDVVSQEKNVMKENIMINSNNIGIHDVNEQYYDVELYIDTSIKNLVT